MDYQHVIQRAQERLNLDLSEFDCECISKMVQNGDCEFIRSGWRAVKYKGRIFKVCYSKKKHQITTVLAIT